MIGLRRKTLTTIGSEKEGDGKFSAIWARLKKKQQCNAARAMDELCVSNPGTGVTSSMPDFSGVCGLGACIFEESTNVQLGMDDTYFL